MLDLDQLETANEHEQAASALAEHVIARAEHGGYAITSEIRRHSLALMRRLTREQLDPTQLLHEFLRGFRLILRQFEPVLAQVVTDANLAAFMRGGQSVVESVQLPEPPDWTRHESGPGEPTPLISFPIIDEAAADLAARNILTAAEFYSARGEARIEGFTVSRVASLDALEKVRDSLVEAIVDGDTLRTWRGKVAEALDGSGLSPARQETVFRTNLFQAYSRGQRAVVEQPLVRSAASFVLRSCIDDSRLTSLCNALSHGGFQGTGIYLTDSETWRRVASPSHFACRCSNVFLTLKRAAEKGIKVAQQWFETGIRPTDAELFVPMPDLSDVPESERRQFASWVSPWAA